MNIFLLFLNISSCIKLIDHLDLNLQLIFLCRLNNNNFSKISMQIFVKNLHGKSLILDVQPSYTIQMIRDLIYARDGKPQQKTMLIFAGRLLQGEKTLNEYNIQKESTIHMVFVNYGGGFSSIQFNNLEKPITGKFSKQAPAWRIVNRGLSLEGICINPKCQAFKKKVWISKHFGKFNMTMEVYKSPCPMPMCGKFCEKVENMALYQATCISSGRIKGEEEERNMESRQTKEDQFLTFEDKDETRVEWLYLEMEVLPL